MKHGYKFRRDELEREEHLHRRGGGHRRKEHIRGAKTFRRGKALEFLERLTVRQATLKQQLESPELQSINPILVGELKAVETIMDEFSQLFDIQKDELKQSEEDK